MTSPLRPMHPGEILDRAIEIYRSRFTVYLAISAITVTAMRSVSIADRPWFHRRSLLPPGRPPGDWILNILVWLGIVHTRSLIGSVFVPWTVRQTWSEMIGEKDSIPGSLGFGLRRWRSFLWIGTLKLRLGALAAETRAAILMLASGAIAGWVDPTTGPGAVAAAVLALGLAGLMVAQWLGACFSLSVANATVGDLGGMAAFSRSWRMTRERRWPIQFPWIALFVSELGPYYGFGYLLRWGWMMAWHAWHFHDLPSVLECFFVVLNIILSSLIGPIFSIASTPIYYDQRIRKEGYDIEQMMDAAGLSLPAVPVTAADADSAEAEVQPG